MKERLQQIIASPSTYRILAGLSLNFMIINEVIVSLKLAGAFIIIAELLSLYQSKKNG